MTKMITKKEDCLLSKTRRMSHQAVVYQSSQRRMTYRKTPRWEQKQQVH
jgi:hypothetical protein